MRPKSKSVSKAPRHLARFSRIFVGVLSLICSLISSAQAGSLWREAVTDERGMLADKRARRLGDIVTVSIAEDVKATNSAVLSTNRSAAGDKNGLATGLVNSIIGAAEPAGVADSAIRRKFPLNLVPRPPGQTPTILSTTPASSVSKAGGSITNEQTMNLTMAVQVIDVLPNGNLVIEGIRQIAFSKERQFLSLRGVVRPADINASNTVASSAVADMRMDVVSEGALSDAQRKGWLMKLDEKITPY